MKLVLPNSRANRGRWYQRLVTAACRLYDAQERAYIAEIPTPMGIAKGGEAAFFKEKAITDYFGALRGGRSVAFDAKGSLDGSYRAGVPDNQLRVMERVHQLGGISGILIGFQVRETVQSWWIPWPSARAIASGKWTPERVAALAGALSVRFVGYIDFLPALEAASYNNAPGPPQSGGGKAEMPSGVGVWSSAITPRHRPSDQVPCIHAMPV